MKTPILKSVITILVLISSLSSCTDDTDTTPPIVEPTSLSYAEGGESLSYVTNPYASASTKRIFGNNATTNIVNIKLQSLIIGAYPISSENSFTYTRVGTTSPWTAISGTIYIDSASDNKVSGFFNLTAGDSDLGINTVSGKFHNIPVNP